MVQPRDKIQHPAVGVISSVKILAVVVVNTAELVHGKCECEVQQLSCAAVIVLGTSMQSTQLDCYFSFSPASAPSHRRYYFIAEEVGKAEEELVALKHGICDYPPMGTVPIVASESSNTQSVSKQAKSFSP